MDWSTHRNSNYDGPKVLLDSQLKKASKHDLSYSMERFVLEVRNKLGNEYSATTLHHIVCGIMRFIRSEQAFIDFFSDPEFAEFRQTLDGEMKRLQSKGIGSQVRKAEVLTPEEEELLWTKGFLGDHSPQALLNTVFFMNGLYFALRSGSEHRNLRLNPPQIRVVETSGKRPYLQYTEDISKNNQGGLKHRKQAKKDVKHYANEDNPSRCYVRLHKLYISKLSPDSPSNSFYFKPLQKFSFDGVWYSKQPIGHNTLTKMMTNLCSKAGISGFKTNHSLRATAASRLYHNGIDEQLIMERTGHKSIDGVRSYKRTNEEQLVEISKVLHQSAPLAIPREDKENDQTKGSVLSGLQLHNCTNVNIIIKNN